MTNRNRYVSSFSERYAGERMQQLFSSDFKFSTWRKLWVILAESEKELGIAITDEQIAEMKEHIYDINYEDAERKEREIRHDVMSHIYAYGLQCPQAAGIIHLGATSCYVGDNTDILIMKEGLEILKEKLVTLLRQLAGFSRENAAMSCLAYTHFQAAQPTTVGKRAALWMDGFLSDLKDLEYVQSSLRLLGCKGTTGTQASFLELFENDEQKCRELEEKIAEKTGMKCCEISGQTYNRKTDARVLNVLSGIAQSAHKFANDIRLLQHLKEVEEPFEKQQVGSSAMPYKRNPMRCERITGLARYLITDALNPAMTASEQWLERTLDDSANRRVSVSEGFLCADAILNLMINVSDGLVVYPEMMRRHLEEELPFMSSESILMDAVKAGGDRQILHEKLRKLSMSAGERIKKEGKDNDLFVRILEDPDFCLTKEDIRKLKDPDQYTGLAEKQVYDYLDQVVYPYLKQYDDIENEKITIEI